MIFSRSAVHDILTKEPLGCLNIDSTGFACSTNYQVDRDPAYSRNRRAVLRCNLDHLFPKVDRANQHHLYFINALVQPYGSVYDALLTQFDMISKLLN